MPTISSFSLQQLQFRARKRNWPAGRRSAAGRKAARASFTTLEWICLKLEYRTPKILLDDLNWSKCSVNQNIYSLTFSHLTGRICYSSFSLLGCHSPCSVTMVAFGSPTGPDATNRSPKPSGFWDFSAGHQRIIARIGSGESRRLYFMWVYPFQGFLK